MEHALCYGYSYKDDVLPIGQVKTMTMMMMMIIMKKKEKKKKPQKINQTKKQQQQQQQRQRKEHPTIPFKPSRAHILKIEIKKIIGRRNVV